MSSRSIDPDDRERIITRPQSGDDDPVCLTRFQMQKIACIIDATIAGHELWRDPAMDFLHTAAAESGRPGSVHPSAAERWERDLAHLPWPVRFQQLVQQSRDHIQAVERPIARE